MIEKVSFIVIVANININYRSPAVLVDLLTITSQVEDLSEKSGVLSQIITCGHGDDLVIDALTAFVCTSLRTQKRLPIEGALHDRSRQHAVP